MHSKKSSKAHSSRKSKTPKGRMPLGPPTIKMQPIIARKMQFQATTANALNQVMLVSQLAKMCVGFMALTAVTTGFFSNMFRIRKVSLWAPPPVQGSLTMISLKFADQFNNTAGISAPCAQSGDSSMEPDRPAKCKLVPVVGTSWDWFQTINSGNNCIVVTCPIGSVLQISYEHYLDNSGTITAGPTVAAATPGVIYNASVTTSGGLIWVPHTSVNTISA